MNPRQTPGRLLLRAVIALALAAATIIFGFWYTSNRASPESGDIRRNGNPSRDEMEAFLDRSVSPLLVSNSQRNAQAVNRLMGNVHDLFEGYRGRVPAFTNDITGFGNKTKITWEAVKQLASDDKQKVQRHVTSKFEMHVVSADRLQLDLEQLLDGFRSDIVANNNLLLSEIEAAVANDPKMAALEIQLPETFKRDVLERIQAASRQTGTDAVVMSGVTFLTAVAAEETARMLVTAVLARVASSMATSMTTTAATAGGTTAAGGTGGGAVGTLGGPPGVVIGIGVGLIVGCIVDYVMTERMEDKLNTECREFLTNTENELLTTEGGLGVTAYAAVKSLDESQASAIANQILNLP